MLKNNGYSVKVINLLEMEKSDCYNPVFLYPGRNGRGKADYEPYQQYHAKGRNAIRSVLGKGRRAVFAGNLLLCVAGRTACKKEF